MTVYEKIMSMTIDEFAEWFDKYCTYDDDLCINWWNDNYCRKCEPEIGHYKGSDREIEFSWCELHNKCRFFQDMDSMPNRLQTVKLWLESRV